MYNRLLSAYQRILDGDKVLLLLKAVDMKELANWKACGGGNATKWPCNRLYDGEEGMRPP